MHRRDISKALFASAAGATVISQRAQAQTCTAPCYPRTPEEIAAGVTPVNLTYPPGHLYRFGTNTTPGTTDMTAAAITWASVGGELSLPVPDTVLVKQSIPLVSNSTITLHPAATLLTNVKDISILLATSLTNVLIQGGKLQLKAGFAGANAHFGLVRLENCTYCTVQNVECIGAQWAGISLEHSDYCLIQGNHIRDTQGTGSSTDIADISLYNGCSWNVIANNRCYGGLLAEHGILMLNTDTTLQTRNTVYGNRIGEHSAYGIIHYLIHHANTYCTIENNLVENITGTDTAGNTGCGIYNQGAGGTLIANNTIRNCCISTTANSLTPAGIGVNLEAGFETVNVIGNAIYDMAQFYGIEVLAGPCNITGNTVHFSAGSQANIGIYANNASNVSVTGNHVTIDTGITNGHGIFVFANTANLANVVIGNNYIHGCSQRQIRVDTTGAPLTSNVVISGNNMTGGGASCIPLQLGNVALASITGNVAIAGASFALTVQTCTQTRYANNVFTSAGATSVLTAGACTGSYFDKSNYWNGQLQNGAIGMVCEQLASTTPAVGNISAAGDRVEQSSPLVGQPKGWRCTAAGGPGTWVSEGNL
jgi:parallel beta-helix repeat protein